jgi:hypothetical protein
LGYCATAFAQKDIVGLDLIATRSVQVIGVMMDSFVAEPNTAVVLDLRKSFLQKIP